MLVFIPDCLKKKNQGRRAAAETLILKRERKIKSIFGPDRKICERRQWSDFFEQTILEQSDQGFGHYVQNLGQTKDFSPAKRYKQIYRV